MFEMIESDLFIECISEGGNVPDACVGELLQFIATYKDGDAALTDVLEAVRDMDNGVVLVNVKDRKSEGYPEVGMKEVLEHIAKVAAQYGCRLAGTLYILPDLANLKYMAIYRMTQNLVTRFTVDDLVRNVERAEKRGREMVENALALNEDDE